MALLNNGLQYSIENPIENYWDDLIMETEQAIRKLGVKMQAPFRIMATKTVLIPYEQLFIQPLINECTQNH
jgi:hypothetical protein